MRNSKTTLLRNVFLLGILVLVSSESLAQNNQSNSIAACPLDPFTITDSRYIDHWWGCSLQQNYGETYFYIRNAEILSMSRGTVLRVNPDAPCDEDSADDCDFAEAIYYDIDGEVDIVWQQYRDDDYLPDVRAIVKTPQNYSMTNPLICIRDVNFYADNSKCSISIGLDTEPECSDPDNPDMKIIPSNYSNRFAANRKKATGFDYSNDWYFIDENGNEYSIPTTGSGDDIDFDFNSSFTVTGRSAVNFEYGETYGIKLCYGGETDEELCDFFSFEFAPLAPYFDVPSIVMPECIGGDATVEVEYSSTPLDMRYEYNLIKYSASSGACDDPHPFLSGYCGENEYTSNKKYVSGGTSSRYVELDKSDFPGMSSFSAGYYLLTITPFEVTSSGDIQACYADSDYEYFEVRNPTNYTPLSTSNISLFADKPSCEGNDDGEIQASATSGVGNGDIEYKLSTQPSSAYFSIGDGSIENLSAGTYIVNFRDDCSVISKSITIGNGDKIGPVVSSVLHPTCNSDGRIVMTRPTGFSTVEYSLDGTNYQSSNTLSNVSSGNKTIYMRLDGNCVSSLSTTTLDPLPTTTPVVTIEENPGCRDGNVAMEIYVPKSDVNGSQPTFSYEYDILDGTTKVVDDRSFSTNSEWISNLVSDIDYTVVVRDKCLSTDGTQIFSGTLRSDNLGVIFINDIDDDNFLVDCFEDLYRDDISINVGGGSGEYSFSIKHDDGTDYSSYLTDGTSNTNFTMTLLPIGTYTVEVGDDNCPDSEIASTTFEINVINSDETDGAIEYTRTIGSLGLLSNYELKCRGDNDGWVEINVSGGNPDTDFSSDPNTHATQHYNVVLKDSDDDEVSSFTECDLPLATCFRFEGLPAGVYYPVITDENSCEKDFNSETFEIREPDTELSIANITVSDFEGSEVVLYTPDSRMYAKCHDAIFTLDPANSTTSGGVTPYDFYLNSSSSSFDPSVDISWSDGETSITNTFRVIDDNGCERIRDFTIYNPDLLELTLDDNVSYHHGASVQCREDATSGQVLATASGGKIGYDYHMTGETDQDADDISGSNTYSGLAVATGGGTSYNVSLIDGLGCSINEDLLLTRPSQVTISEVNYSDADYGGIQIPCKEETIEVEIVVEGGSDPSVYFGAGEYNVTIDKSGTDGYYTYPLTRSTVSGRLTIELPAGDYDITANDGYDCETSLTYEFSLSEPDDYLAMTTAVVTAPNCISDTDGDQDLGLIEVTASGGTGPSSAFKYTYTLTDQSAGVSPQEDDSSDGEMSFDAPANGYSSRFYTLRVEDVNGCYAEQTVEMIRDQNPLQVEVSTTAPSCYDARDGEIEFRMTNATADDNGNYVYTLSGANLSAPAGISHPSTVLTLDTLRDTNIYGNYSIFVEDRYGCDVDATVNQIAGIALSAPPELLIDSFATVRPSFRYMSDGLFAVYATGGTGTYHYSLNGADFVSSDLSNDSYWLVSDTLSAEYTVYLRDSQYNGVNEYCQREVSLIVPEGRVISLAESDSVNVLCKDASNGQVRPIFTLDNGNPGELIDYDNLSVDWENQKGTLEGTASINTSKDGIEPIVGLDPDSYTLEATYEFSSYLDFSSNFNYEYAQDTVRTIPSRLIRVDEPEALELTFNSIYDATCGRLDDGRISFSSSGGWPSVRKEYNLNGSGWVEFNGTQVLSGLSVDEHDISVGFSSGSCVSTYGFEISEGGLSVEIDTIVHPKSYGSSDGYVILSVTTNDAVTYKKVSDASYSSSSGLYEGLSAGTHEFYVYKDAIETCESERVEAALIEPDALNIDLSLSNSDCGQNNGSASAEVSGGVSPYNERWEDTDGVEVDSDYLTAGEYVFYVTDANLIGSVVPFEIEDNPGISIEDLVVTPADCSYPNGTASFTINLGISPYYIQDVEYTDSEIILTNLYAGDTLISVSDDRGCSLELTIEVSSQSTLDVSLFRSEETTCSESNGVLEVLVTGGALPYTYEWIGYDESTRILSGLSPGNYTVEVTDAYGCQTNLEASVIAADGIEEVLWTISSPYCEMEDGTIEITSITGDYSPFEIYSETRTERTFLSTHDNKSSTILSGFGSGDHVLGVYDSNDCRFEINITLEDDPGRLPTYTSEVTQQSACDQATGSLVISNESGVGPFTYDWFDNEGLSLGIMSSEVESIAAAEYLVKATDGAGCEIDLVVEMTDMEAPSVSLEQRTTTPIGASNGTITMVLSGGGGSPYEYVLNDQTNQTGYFDGLSLATYSLSGFDQYGCTSDTIMVSVLGTEQLDVSVVSSSSSTCELAADGGGEVMGAGGITPYEYYIDEKVIEERFVGLTTGAYWVKIIDSIGSIDSVEIEIPVLEELSVNTYSTMVSCEGDCDGTLDLDIMGGSGSYEVSWSDGVTGESRTALCAGTYQYTLADNTNTICGLTGSITIEEEPYLELYLEETEPPTCYDGEDGVLSVYSTGGSGNYVYDWESGRAEDTEVGSPGDYSLTVSDTYLGCTVDSVFTIPNQEEIMINPLVTQPACYGSATGSVTLELEHAPSALVVWEDGQIGFTASDLQSGTYGYDIESSLGCMISGEVTVTERNRLAATTAQTNNLCSGFCQGEISLSISGGVTPYYVAWSHGSSSLNPKDLCNGTYEYHVTDAYGCTVEGSVEITEPEQLSITSFTVTDVYCASGSDGSIVLTVEGGTGEYAYEWSDGSTESSLSGATIGDYSVVISDENDCGITGSYEIKEPDALGILSVTTLDPSCTGYSDGEIVLTPFGGIAPYDVIWDNGKTGSSADELVAGLHGATITDGNGCSIYRDWRLYDPAGMQFSGVTFNDPICNDEATGNISFTVIGGSGEYSYEWTGLDGDNSMDSLTWGDYEVVANDGEDCEITRSFTLVNPDIPVITGIEDYYILCIGGQVYLEPDTDWKTYDWTGPEGFTSIEKSVTLSEHGEYALSVTDELDCPSHLETFVEVSDNPLDPDFIRISEAVTFEPVIFIDLSIPLPDRMNWILPEDESIVVNEQTDISMELVFTQPGDYEIGMELGLSNCTAELYKTISVADGSASRFLQESEEVVPVSVKVSPNPTSDEVQLIFNAPDESPLEVQLVNTEHRAFKRQVLEGKKDYLLKWNLKDSPSGVYFLIFSQDGKVQSKRILLVK